MAQTRRNARARMRAAVSAGVAAFVIGVAGGGFAACGDDNEGPAEDAGKAVDEAGKDVGNELEEAGKEAEQEVDDGKKD